MQVGTLSSVASWVLDECRIGGRIAVFNLIIVDEGSQATIPSAIVVVRMLSSELQRYGTLAFLH